MLTDTKRARQELAERLRRHKRELSERVNDAFFVRHPDWATRYGERGRARGREDAAYHIDFLASAIEAGSVGAFERYAEWTRGMLRSRGIASHFVEESLQQVEDALAGVLDSEQKAYAARYLTAGRTVCASPLAGHEDRPESALALPCDLYLQSILSGQRQAAVNIVMETLRDGQTRENVYVDVLQEAMYRVGQKWENNEITVAEEHLATAVTEYVLACLYNSLPRARLLFFDAVRVDQCAPRL